MQLLNGHAYTQRPPQRVTPALSIFDVCTRLLTICLVTALLLLLAFDVAPSLRDSAEALREYRDGRDRHNTEEVRRLRMLEDAQKRQVNNEALLLVQQEENLRRAREVSKTLRGVMTRTFGKFKKFRKKPVVVEAVQWFPGMEIEGCGEFGLPPDETGNPCLVINTLEGKMTARPGDWIIRGIRGELYPCKPDIFAATYYNAES